MASAALADVLIDFGARPRVPATGPASPLAGPNRPATVVTAAAPPPDIDAVVARAVETAIAETQAAVSARFEEEMERRLAEEKAQHHAELEAERARLGVELAGQVSQAFSGLERRITDETTSIAARILGQFATEALRLRAVEALARSIRAAIGDEDTVRIRVRGPQSLFLPFSAAMGDLARHLEFTENDAADLTATLDETLFETRLAEWAQALSSEQAS